LIIFWRNFLINPINCTQFCLKFVVNFTRTRVNGLVIKIAYNFQYRKYNKFRVTQNRGHKLLLGMPTTTINNKKLTPSLLVFINNNITSCDAMIITEKERRHKRIGNIVGRVLTKQTVPQQSESTCEIVPDSKLKDKSRKSLFSSFSCFSCCNFSSFIHFYRQPVRVCQHRMAA